MKAVCVLLLAFGLFSASSAQFDDLVSAGSDLFDTLKDAAIETGKKLLQDLLTNGLSSLVGKREVTSLGDWFSQMGDKLKELADKGKDMAKGVFDKAVEKLKNLTDMYHAAIGTVKDAAQITDQIDSVVAEHHSRQKRVIKELIQKGKEVVAGVYDTAKDLLTKVGTTVKGHASNLVSGALQKAVDLFGFGKRQMSLSDHLKTIGDALSSAVSPFKDAVSGLGETLKGHFSNLVDTVKGHADSLKTKLDPHISDLKEHGKTLLNHGKNALSALSEVLGDILNQTVQNASGSLSGIAGTLTNAGQTVVGHFAGDDSSN